MNKIQQSIGERERTRAAARSWDVVERRATPVESSARAGPFAKEFEDADGPFVKELEVTAGPLAKGVLAPAYEEDEACASILPPARRTGRVRSSCRRPEVSDDDLWLGGW